MKATRVLTLCSLALHLAAAPALGAGTPAAEAPGRVRLNWIGHWKGEDLRERFVVELKRDYEFLHPEVNINLVFDADLPGSERDHKLRSAKAIVDMVTTGRIDWDVVYLDHGVFEHVAEQLKDRAWTARHLVDFSTVPGFAASQEPFITADPRFRERTGGILTGPYTESYLMNVWYNTEVAAKTGVRVRERGMTVNDFVACAEQLQRYNRKYGTAVTFLKLSAFNRTDTLFESLFRSQFADHAAAVAPVFTEAKARAFLRALEAFERIARHQPVVNRGWQDLTIEEWRRRTLVDDDALFVLGGTFMYSHYRGADPARAAKMRPIENPALGPTRVLVGDYTPVFAVMKNSPRRDVAIDFLMSSATPKNAERWVRYTKNLTGVRGYLSDTTSRQVDAFGDVYEKYLVDMLASNGDRPIVNLRNPTYVFGADTPVSVVELREKLTAILEGTLTAGAYYDDVMRRLGARGR
jgi:ABC-type glycerol-3-phosphate transport system substrate-binding protein